MLVGSSHCTEALLLTLSLSSFRLCEHSHQIILIEESPIRSSNDLSENKEIRDNYKVSEGGRKSLELEQS